jgi:hypothetical protein
MGQALPVKTETYLQEVLGQALPVKTETCLQEVLGQALTLVHLLRLPS